MLLTSISTKWHVVCFLCFSPSLCASVCVGATKAICVHLVLRHNVHSHGRPHHPLDGRLYAILFFMHHNFFFVRNINATSKSKEGQETSTNTRQLACESRKQIIRTLASLIINSMNYLEYFDEEQMHWQRERTQQSE